MRAWSMALGIPSFGAQAYVPHTDPGCHCAWSIRYWERQREAEELLKTVEDFGYGLNPLAEGLTAARVAVARLRLAGACQ